MSPTIIKTGNLRVVVYPGDHGPPHVHVFGSGAEAKFRLDNLECLYSRGFSARALHRIGRFIGDNLDLLWEAWNEYQT